MLLYNIEPKYLIEMAVLLPVKQIITFIKFTRAPGLSDVTRQRVNCKRDNDTIQPALCTGTYCSNNLSTCCLWHGSFFGRKSTWETIFCGALIPSFFPCACILSRSSSRLAVEIWHVEWNIYPYLLCLKKRDRY